MDKKKEVCHLDKDAKSRNLSRTCEGGDAMSMVVTIDILVLA